MKGSDFAFLTTDLPFAFTAETDVILASAAELGRESGRDDTWVPKCLEEALFEVLVSAGGHDACIALGVVPRPDLIDTPQAADLFTLRLDMRATEDEDQLWEMMDYLPRGWPQTTLAGCIAVLMVDAPPLDLGVEIVDYGLAENLSSHEKLARETRIVRSRALGAEPQ